MNKSMNHPGCLSGLNHLIGDRDPTSWLWVLLSVSYSSYFNNTTSYSNEHEDDKNEYKYHLIPYRVLRTDSSIPWSSIPSPKTETEDGSWNSRANETEPGRQRANREARWALSGVFWTGYLWPMGGRRYGGAHQSSNC